MQTPASMYEPSPRPYPAPVPEVEYPDTMEVRTVKSQGCFRWNKQDIFLTEVLWGESIGLLPAGHGLFTVYFAHLPLVGFDSKRGKLVPLANPGWPKSARSGPGQACPGPETQNQNLPEKEKVSGMCPV